MKSIFNEKCEEYSVSPVIGVILLVAITVILAAVIGVMVFGIGDDLNIGSQAGVIVEGGEAKLISLSSSERVIVEYENGSIANLTQPGDTVTVYGNEKIIAVSENGEKSLLTTVSPEEGATLTNNDNEFSEVNVYTKDTNWDLGDVDYYNFNVGSDYILQDSVSDEAYYLASNPNTDPYSNYTEIYIEPDRVPAGGGSVTLETEGDTSTHSYTLDQQNLTIDLSGTSHSGNIQSLNLTADGDGTPGSYDNVTVKAEEGTMQFTETTVIDAEAGLDFTRIEDSNTNWDTGRVGISQSDTSTQASFSSTTSSSSYSNYTKVTLYTNGGGSDGTLTVTTNGTSESFTVNYGTDQEFTLSNSHTGSIEFEITAPGDGTQDEVDFISIKADKSSKQ